MIRCSSALVLAVMVTASATMAQCDISGIITAAPSGSPSLPAWEYTLDVTWNTGTPYGVSNISLLLDGANGTCECADFATVLTRVSPAGESTGNAASCGVVWDSFLECNGDPSIPGIDGIVLKFEPRSGACEPGTVGGGSFVFYSDLGPVPVNEDIISLSDKFGSSFCLGNLAGVFPGMACDPVPSLGATWGAVKGLYR